MFKWILIASLGFSVLVLAVLMIDVVSTGSPVLTGRLGDFLTGTLRTQAPEAGLYQGIVGSFWICVFVVVLAFPLGIGAALYLEEYAADTRFSRFVNVNIRNLAGVPSIVYGILGFTIFTKALQGITGPGRAEGERSSRPGSRWPSSCCPSSSSPPPRRSGPCPTPCGRLATASAPTDGR